MTKRQLPPFRFPQAAQAVFILAALAATLVNAAQLIAETVRTHRQRAIAPYPLPGNKFLGLNDFIPGASRIGYYTDKNLDINEHAMQFSQAQYVLAPIILDLNNTGHKFVIFDCSSEDVAMVRIREFQLVPFKRNPFGIILAVNPAASGGRQKVKIPLF
ncbi:MAG: hypothetical protein Q8Q08_03180 [Candidatus Omnitrophota bacterium]|nr:hypothetical protein [Candidatus Omnitrophota bacterium]MDZ4241464.1 hypothetical protein [Candidatus Omnitrophota bacterium]